LAVAAPMPVVPPVIRAILPSSFAIRKVLPWLAELHHSSKRRRTSNMDLLV
jgi:hypothetical protein